MGFSESLRKVLQGVDNREASLYGGAVFVVVSPFFGFEDLRFFWPWGLHIKASRADGPVWGDLCRSLREWGDLNIMIDPKS